MGFTDRPEEKDMLDLKAAAAEFIAMMLFVIIGCGVACGHGASDGQTRLVVAFAFGMAILVLAYSIGHHSGGHINCAVTFSLVLGGQVDWKQGLLNLFAQLCGSLVGAGFLAGIFDCDNDMTLSLGSNIVAPNFTLGQAFLGEVLMTFLLCFVVYETAVNKETACGKNACIAIGFAVFLAHLFLLPIDGCSINPTRSFGPAIVTAIRNCENRPGNLHLEHLWVTWAGPLVGAALAAVFQRPFVVTKDPPVEVPEKDTTRNTGARHPSLGHGSTQCEAVGVYMMGQEDTPQRTRHDVAASTPVHKFEPVPST